MPNFTQLDNDKKHLKKQLAFYTLVQQEIKSKFSRP